MRPTIVDRYTTNNDRTKSNLKNKKKKLLVADYILYTAQVRNNTDDVLRVGVEISHSVHLSLQHYRHTIIELTRPRRTSRTVKKALNRVTPVSCTDFRHRVELMNY